MKRKPFSLIFFCLLLSLPSISQVWTPQMLDSDVAHISFVSDTINCGSIKYKGNGYKEMRYINTGKCPLLIWGVTGLATRQLVVTKKFLLPGDSGLIKVYYPTDVAGNFFKTLTIYSNAQKAKYIYIKGTVMPEEICADMKIASDYMDLGPVHYAYGKHFTIKVPSTGTCALNFTVAPGDDYLDVINYNNAPVQPGDTGKIDIHIGGQVVGNYYGTLDIYSSNAKTRSKSIFIKASFMPPDEKDSTLTEIKAAVDMIDVGSILQKQVIVTYTIKNTGKHPLSLRPSSQGADIIKLSSKPVAPGKTTNIEVSFNMDNTVGPFIKHISVTGNFKGIAMPLYIKGNVKPN